MDDNFVGNFSTIVKFVLMTVAGYLLGALASKGLNLPIDASQLSEILFTILCFLWAYVDAKNPNSFKCLGNAPKGCSCETELDLINEEYEEYGENEGV